MSARQAPEDPVSALFGDDLGEGVRRAMGRIEIAEEEVGRFDDEATPFLALQPTSLLDRVTDVAYRHHCAELVARRGDGLGAPTAAEYCAALAATSLQAPLNHAAAWLYWKHFDRIWPGAIEEPYADDWDRSDEAQHELELGVATAVASDRNHHRRAS